MSLSEKINSDSEFNPIGTRDILFAEDVREAVRELKNNVFCHSCDFAQVPHKTINTWIDEIFGKELV